MNAPNPFGTRGTLRLGSETAVVYRLRELARQGLANLDRLPFSIRVLLENALRHAGRGFVSDAHVRALAGWAPAGGPRGEIPFMPARVVLQDFTGVPCVVDLAAMRDAMARMNAQRRSSPGPEAWSPVALGRSGEAPMAMALSRDGATLATISSTEASENPRSPMRSMAASKSFFFVASDRVDMRRSSEQC